MAKYNIQPKKEKIARYQSMLSEETKDPPSRRDNPCSCY